jgi:dipeptidyl aminopeptidase/acylaminoacyl peptidase
MTRIDTGQFCNLTRGRCPDLVDSTVRMLGFSPDGAVVTVETLSPETGAVGRWAIPLVSDSQPSPASESAADWPCDASQRHAPCAVWAPRRRFVYFVQGASPGAADLWRIEPSGGDAERMTFHDARVSHPVFVDDSTLLYLVGDEDATGSRLRALDLRDRTSHPIGSDEDRYTSLAASAEGRRLAATRGTSVATLWRLTIADPGRGATPIVMRMGRGSSPVACDARHVRVLDDGALVVLRADGGRHNLWLVDAHTGAERQLTDFGPGFTVHGFDLSSDGRAIVVEHVQERSDIVLIDCAGCGD